MKSKFLAILTLIFALCIPAAYADEVNVDSSINFVSQSGETIHSFPDVTGADYTMYASANVKNNTELQKELLLFAAIYDKNDKLIMAQAQVHRTRLVVQGIYSDLRSTATFCTELASQLHNEVAEIDY